MYLFTRIVQTVCWSKLLEISQTVNLLLINNNIQITVSGDRKSGYSSQWFSYQVQRADSIIWCSNIFECLNSIMFVCCYLIECLISISINRLFEPTYWMYEPLMSIQTMLPKHYVKLLCKTPVCLKMNIFLLFFIFIQFYRNTQTRPPWLTLSSRPAALRFAPPTWPGRPSVRWCTPPRGMWTPSSAFSAPLPSWPFWWWSSS